MSLEINDTPVTRQKPLGACRVLVNQFPPMPGSIRPLFQFRTRPP